MRSNILAVLRQARGAYVSGEEIARALHVSRTAVWKHIHELKQAGYSIDSHSRSGYCLREIPDLLLPNEVQNGLATKVIGQEILYHKELVSTNNEAKRLAANGAAHGTVVVSESQNGGRGRLSRGWYSPASKGLWFSVILRPDFLPQEAPKCTLLAAVAIATAVRQVCGVDVGIKWPNDILFEGRKLAGILTEMSAEMDCINYIVIGMGINANIDATDFPEEISGIATSLSAIKGGSVARLPLLQAVLLELEILCDQVKRDGFRPVLEKWKQYSVTLGQSVNVIGINDTFSGMAMDIDDDGALLVKTSGGIQRVLAGDVSIRSKEKQ